MVLKAASCLALAASSILGLLGAQALGETAAAETGLATTVVATTAEPVTSGPDEEPELEPELEPEPDPEPEPEEPADEADEQPGASAATMQEPASPAPAAVHRPQPRAGRRAHASGAHPVRRAATGTSPDRPRLARAARERYPERRGAAPDPANVRCGDRYPPHNDRAAGTVASASVARQEQLFDLPLVSSLIPRGPPMPPRGLAAVALATTGVAVFGILAFVLRFFRRTWNP